MNKKLKLINILLIIMIINLQMAFFPVNTSAEGLSIPPGTEYKFAAGGYHALAVKNDGTVICWGYNGVGECNVPTSLNNVIAVAGGGDLSLALKSNGTVVAWGDNYYGECNVPQGLSNVTKISTSGSHSLALKSDGTVAAWGYNNFNQCNVPSNLSGVKDIAAGFNYSLALKTDGTVIAWGNSPYNTANVPSGLNNVISICAGTLQAMALKADGTVVVWGDGSNGQLNVPTGLQNVKAIASGTGHCLALKNDGTVVAWGSNEQGVCDVPSGLNNVIAISAYDRLNLALKSDGTLVAWGYNNNGVCNIPAGLNLLSGFESPPTITSLSPTGAPIHAGDKINVTTSKDGFVYLVPTNTQSTYSAIDAAGQSTSTARKIAAQANTPVLIDTSGISPGYYRVYASDTSNNLSSPSGEINILAGNLIINGDFDLDVSSYGSWEAYTFGGTAQFYTDDTTYHTTGQSILIQGNDTNSFIRNIIGIQHGKEYSFSAWGLSQNVTTSSSGIGTYVYLAQYDKNGQVINGTQRAFTSVSAISWDQAQTSFIADGNATTFAVMLGLEGSGLVWYDDVSLTEIPLEPVAVSLNTTNQSITVGNSVQLSAVVTTQSITNKSVQWSVVSQSAVNVVTVSALGLVTGNNPGTATVRATSNADTSKYADCFIQVSAASTGGAIITTVAGNGTSGSTGDGGLATSASIGYPYGLAIDSAGNVYIADNSNNRIRKVNKSDGKISTFAGTGSAGFSGDGGSATGAALNIPSGIAFDKNGNLYITDRGNNRIRKINASDNKISTIAGNGVQGYSGDGGLATNASLNDPIDIAIDNNNNIYIADMGNNRIRKINASDGKISTVAGDGTSGYPVNNSIATATGLYHPSNVAVDGTGNLFVTEQDSNSVRKISAADGRIRITAGTGSFGYSGDGGDAINASLAAPFGLAVDNSGNLYIADMFNYRVRKVDASNNVINTIAGNGVKGYSDGADPLNAMLDWPLIVESDSHGDIYVGDFGDYRIRKMDFPEEPLSIILNKSSLSLKIGQSEQLTASIKPQYTVDKTVQWSVVSQSAVNVVTVSTFGAITANNAGTAVVRATSNADPTKYADCIVNVITPAGFFVSSATTKPGTDVSLDISLSGCPGVAGGEFLINYDTSKLTPKSFTLGTITQSPVVNLNYQNTGKVYVTWAGSNTTTDGGIIVTVKFTVTGSAINGDIIPVTLTGYSLGDQYANSVTCTAIAGSVRVSTVTKGDVNLDGNIDAADAILILRYAAGLITLSDDQMQAAKVTNDDTINYLDAIKILRYDAGLDSTI